MNGRAALAQQTGICTDWRLGPKRTRHIFLPGCRAPRAGGKLPSRHYYHYYDDDDDDLLTFPWVRDNFYSRYCTNTKHAPSFRYTYHLAITTQSAASRIRSYSNRNSCLASRICLIIKSKSTYQSLEHESRNLPRTPRLCLTSVLLCRQVRSRSIEAVSSAYTRLSRAHQGHPVVDHQSA